MNEKVTRNIIKIDEEKCNGCGKCAKACNEGAISIINGKARLTREDYCDGLGNCLPACPMGAIEFEKRETLPFDEANAGKFENITAAKPHLGKKPNILNKAIFNTDIDKNIHIESELLQWPIQIKLMPTEAPYYKNADLLIAADCTAYAYKNFQNEFMHEKVTIIGCTKLDNIDYTQKITDIIRLNNIKSITVARMTVPCCANIERTVKNAIRISGKNIPLNVAVISTEGIIRK